jgi:O-Antigen ligase
MNSHILFVIFFIISVVKPVDIVNINRFIGMGLFILISIIFLYSILKNKAWKRLWINYQWEIVLIILFLLVNIISLLINLDKFINITELIFYGLSSFAVWIIFPMSWVIFKEHHSEKFAWLSWTLLAFIILVALAQIKIPKLADQITRYSVANDITPFLVEFVDDKVYLSKYNCTSITTNIHLLTIPKNKSDLTNQKSKYNFYKKIKKVELDNKCLVYFKLPSYQIKSAWIHEQKPGAKSPSWFKSYTDIGGNIFKESSPDLRRIISITKNPNIYATISSIIIICCILFILRSSSKKKPIILISLIFLIGLAIYTGINSGSRNFIFTLLIGSLILSLSVLKQHFKLFIALFMIFIVSLNIIIINNSYLANRYGNILPYLLKLNNQHSISLSDFKPNISDLTGREFLWERGINTWLNSPLIGVGAGTFRASATNQAFKNLNLHNYYLQVLVDSGVVGLSLLFFLLALLLWRSRQVGNSALLMAIYSSVIFDNFLDYSIAWVLFMSWSLYFTSNLTNQQLRNKTIKFNY